MTSALAAGVAGSLFAAEPLYITTANQGGSPGNSWASSVIWKLNGTNTAVAASAGNTYEAQSNGTKLGNGTATTLLRNPYSAGTPNIATFPGDSLILDTNTQVRFKFLSTTGASPWGLPYAIPTNNFPGANGLPGLVLNGGCLNNGDSGPTDIHTILGTIYANPGTLSYLDPANTFSGDNQVRAFVIAGQLSGSGSLALLDAVNTVPQQITGRSNTFTGQWFVKSGWLMGTGDGTLDGYNALGTNTACAFTADPQWNVPPTFDAAAVFTTGPAILDFGPSLANIGGKVYLTNGGQLYLHGNVVLGGLTVEGTVLTNGSYSYSNLANTYPNNFGNFPASFAPGFGTLVIQPYGTAPVFAPQITSQPASTTVYPGVNIALTSSAIGNPLNYTWQYNGAPLSDSGNYSGSATPTLTISAASAANIGAYSLVVSNSAGVVTSAVANIAIVSQDIEQAEAAIRSNNPAALFTLNETGDPATNTPAFDFAGGHTAIYGTAVQNGNPNYNIAGPRPANGLPGFSPTNAAAQFSGSANSRITVPPLNLGPTASNVTITCWINPSGTEQASAGIVFCRGGSTVAGINYFTTANAAGNFPIGYTWNNNSATYNFNSGIVPPAGEWSFVALIITPTNAAIYVLNTNSFLNVVNPVANPVAQPFDGPTLIGDDNNDNNSGTRSFNGAIDNVAIFNTNLTESQLVGMFTAGAGTNFNFAPSVQVPPQNTNVYDGQTVILTVQASGPTLGYQWSAGASGSGQYTNLINGGNVSGVNTATLTITNTTNFNALDYIVAVSNFSGLTYSFPPATVTVQQTGPPEQVTMSTQQASGNDWNTGADWSDGNPASLSSVAYPGTTYEVLAGARMRSPNGVQSDAFPGIRVQIDGSGVFVNNPGAGTPQGELRFKNNVNPGTNFFPRLVLAGGQIDNGGNPDGLAVIQGEVDVISNSIIYVDSAGDASRPYRIDAFLTGTATLEYHNFDTTLSPGGLNIAGKSNTFSGTWNIVQGSLLGSGTNSLGTNNILIQTGAGLETLYNINSPHGSLFLSNGVMLLHQNDTFTNVAINGVYLSPGVHPYAQLASNFPANFPATWAALTGSTSNSASGSLTVLNTNPIPVSLASHLPGQADVPSGVNLTYSVSPGGSQPFSFQWYLNGVAVAGATNSTFTLGSTTGTNSLYAVITNPAGSVTNGPAIINGLTVGPVITFNDTNNWTLNSNGVSPTLASGVLTLTDNNLNEAASAFYNFPQYVGGFATTFTYTPGGNVAADGVTFTVQNSPAGPNALGGGGGNLGYFGIANSAGLDLNIYSTATGGVGIAFQTNGAAPPAYGPVTPVTLNGGDPIVVQIGYTNPVMTVTLTDTLLSNVFTTNITVGDLSAAVGGGDAFVGFTGATGGSDASQQISDFSYQYAYVQQTAPATLSIASPSAGSYVISWPTGVLSTLHLQSASSVAGPWSNVTNSPGVVNGSYQVTTSPGAAAQFYRLISP